MRVEQRIEFGETFRRRRQCRSRGATEVVDLCGAEKLDRGKPGHCLLGRDRKARAPQHRGKREEVRDRPGHLGHACASWRIASIRGAIWTRSSSSLRTTPSERRK